MLTRRLTPTLLTTTAALLLSLVPVARAGAQTVATRACKAADVLTLVCRAYDASGAPIGPLPPIRWAFGEGVVHAPGSELAYLLVANYSDTDVWVMAQILTTGGTGVFVVPIHVAPQGRTAYPLHDRPELAGLKTFSVRVTVPDGAVDVALVLRPSTDPWARVVVVPPVVTHP